MKDSRIWFLSDTHFGCRSNSVLWHNLIEDYFFNYFIPLAKSKAKPGDILVHTGDVFDNRQSISLAAQDLAIRVFEKLSTIFKEIHIIVGNHDIMRKYSTEITSVDCLKYIPGITVYKEATLVEFSGVKCLFMPWQTSELMERETIAKYKDSGVSYLFCHTETQNVQTATNSFTDSYGNDLDEFSGFKRVYSGHIHFRQEKKNITYVGNPYQMTRSDRDNAKGIYILNLKTDVVEFIKNEYSPVFIKLYLTDLMNMRLCEIKDIIKDNFVDVMIPSSFLKLYEINDFVMHFDGVARSFETKIYEHVEGITTEDMDKGIDETAYTGSFNILEISRTYIDSLNYEPDLKKKLISSIAELMHNVVNTKE